MEWILAHALERDRTYAVEAANTHVAALARTDQEFGEAMRQFDLICPDGMPLVWALNSQLGADEKLTDRVYGPTLMLEALKATNGRKAEFKHFLAGRQTRHAGQTHAESSMPISGCGNRGDSFASVRRVAGE